MPQILLPSLKSSPAPPLPLPAPLLMWVQGVLPGPVVVIIVGRDVLLVGGAFAARAKSLGWRWPGPAEFFRVQQPEAAEGAAAPEAAAGAAAAAVSSSGATGAAAAEGGAESSGGGSGGSGEGGEAAKPAPPAPLVKPLFISKVNTVFQLGLVGTCMVNAWLGWPGEEAVWAGSVLTAGTTLWTTAAYLRAFRQGRLLAPAGPPPQQQ